MTHHSMIFATTASGLSQARREQVGSDEVANPIRERYTRAADQARLARNALARTAIVASKAG
jgi:hypothetical protein